MALGPALELVLELVLKLLILLLLDAVLESDVVEEWVAECVEEDVAHFVEDDVVVFLTSAAALAQASKPRTRNLTIAFMAEIQQSVLTLFVVQFRDGAN